MQLDVKPITCNMIKKLLKILSKYISVNLKYFEICKKIYFASTSSYAFIPEKKSPSK